MLSHSRKSQGINWPKQKRKQNWPNNKRRKRIVKLKKNVELLGGKWPRPKMITRFYTGRQSKFWKSTKAEKSSGRKKRLSSWSSSKISDVNLWGWLSPTAQLTPSTGGTSSDWVDLFCLTIVILEIKINFVFKQSIPKDSFHENFLLFFMQLESTYSCRGRRVSSMISDFLLQQEFQSGIDIVPRSIVFVLLLSPIIFDVRSILSQSFSQSLMRERCELFNSYNSNLLYK